jgi:5-methylcytosine-specific restriction endonuclease McrA
MEKEKLRKIYRKTDGYCHICHRKLSYSNYGILSAKGAWQIEHSIAKANGGSDHLNNLYPACITCNIKKGLKRTKTARALYGNARAPYSKTKKEAIRSDNTAGGALVGGGLGFAVGGPVGGVIGSIVGGIIGNSNSPNK